MKRNLLILLISLFLPMLSFGQNTYPKIVQDSLLVITQQQLKQTNVIFLEHKKLKTEVTLLNNKIRLQKEVIDKLDTVIMNKNIQISNSERLLTLKNGLITTQDKQISAYKQNIKFLTIGGVTLGLTAIIILLIK